MPFKKFVEIGRVAYGVKGPAEGKLFAIVDVIDYNRVLVDGPCTGVPRQENRLINLSLTKYKINIQHGQHTKFVRKAWEEEKVSERWERSEWAKKVQLKQRKESLTDFERFKVAYLKRSENRAIKMVSKLSLVRKRALRRKRAIKDEKQKSLKASRTLQKKRPGAKVGKLYGKLRTKGVLKERAAKKTGDKKTLQTDAKKAKIAELKKKKALVLKAKKAAAKAAGKPKAVKSTVEKTASKKPAPAKPKKAAAPASKKPAASKKPTAPKPKKIDAKAKAK